MRLAAIAFMGLAGCTGKVGETVEGPPVVMSLDCGEAVRDAVPAGSDLKAIVAAAPPGSTVLVGPGAFRGPIEISGTGVTLRGTCPAVTFIDGDPQSPAIRVFAGGVYIEGLTVRGGAPGIEFSGIAVNGTVRDVVIESAGQHAILIAGQATALVEQVTVRGTEGRGLTVASAAHAEVNGITIDGSDEFGVHVEAAELILRDATITATAPDGAGLLGRGIHAQSGAVVEVFDSVVEGSTEAGISAVDADLSVHGSRVSNTAAGSGGAGDGIAFFRGSDGAGGRALEVTDTEIVGNARAALIADGDVGEVNVFDGAMSGGPYATVAQNEAVLTVDGTQIEPGMQSLVDLVGDAALPVHDEPVD